MAITVNAPSGKSPAPAPISTGSHVAICVSVIDIGTQISTYQGISKPQKKIILTWEIASEIINVNGVDKPKVISREYTRSLAESSTLRAHLEAWRGKAFTATELECFDLVNVLGAPCMLGVSHATKGDRTFANIQAIMPVIKNIKIPDLYNDLLYFDLEDDTWESKYENLPVWLQNKISQSLEYKKLTQGNTLIQEKETVEDTSMYSDEGDLPF